MELVQKEPGCMDIVYGYPKRFFAILQAPGCYTSLNIPVFYPEGENTEYPRANTALPEAKRYQIFRSFVS